MTLAGRALRRLGALPARPVLAAFNAAGAVAAGAAPFVPTLDPSHHWIAGGSPTGVVVLVGAVIGYRLLKRGSL